MKNEYFTCDWSEHSIADGKGENLIKTVKLIHWYYSSNFRQLC